MVAMSWNLMAVGAFVMFLGCSLVFLSLNLWFLIGYSKVVARLRIVRCALWVVLKNPLSNSYRKTYRCTMLLFLCNAQMARDEMIRSFGQRIRKYFMIYAVNSLIVFMGAFAMQCICALVIIYRLLIEGGTITVTGVKHVVGAVSCLSLFVCCWLGYGYLRRMFRISYLLQKRRSLQRQNWV